LDPIVLALATAVGALTGTFVGILLLRRKLRPPISDGELAELKGKLQTGESSLTAANANLDDLRKQVAMQEKALQQSSEDLKKKQTQLDAETEETQKERGRRSAAEQSVQELGAKAVLLTEQCTKLEARVKEESGIAAEKATRLAAVEAESESGRQRIQELLDVTARLSTECAELKRLGEQEARFRGALELQLNAEQERMRQMTTQIAGLQNEHVQLEAKLQEERRSAAKGMELLLLAQEKLSSVFQALGADQKNGHHNPPAAGSNGASPEKAEGESLVQTTSSAA